MAFNRKFHQSELLAAVGVFSSGRTAQGLIGANILDCDLQFFSEACLYTIVKHRNEC